MSGSADERPVGYSAADPNEPMSIALRQQMRGDVCGHCGARVLVHAVGFREHKKQYAAKGITLKILCAACFARAQSELPPGPWPIAFPPSTDPNNN